MCIGVPMQVVEAAGDGAAWCVGRDGRVLIDLALVGPQSPGTWLLTWSEGNLLLPQPASRVSCSDAWL